MDADCHAILVDRIRRSGPITVAEYMEVALYAPGAGYYARAVQRSGRAGDFVTSVDVGPLFGELLAVGICELWHQWPADGEPRPDGLALVEVGAGNGRLSRDVLDAISRRDRSLYDSIQLHLVEPSAPARASQPETLGPHAAKLMGSSADLPDCRAGVLFANELLDAFPVHLVAMTSSGLGEIYVDLEGESFVERLGPPSTERLAGYFEDLGISLHPGVVVDVNLAAVDWIHEASRHLGCGFVILIDYGYEARTLYADPNAVGTLTAFSRHMADPPGTLPRAFGDPGSEDPGLHQCDGRPIDRARARRPPSWLVAPGTRDLTSHVDFTTLRREAARAGFSTLSVSSQSRFLLDLVERSGLLSELDRPDRLRDRLALKSLLVPGGLGSSHTVIVLGKNNGPGTDPSTSGVGTSA